MRKTNIYKRMSVVQYTMITSFKYNKNKNCNRKSIEVLHSKPQKNYKTLKLYAR